MLGPVIALGLLVASGCSKVSEPKPSPASNQTSDSSPLPVPRGLLVAHAMGAVDGVPETNAIEALRCNHRRGFRWFEVDLSLTADDQVVCFHRQREKQFGLSREIGELRLQDLEGAKYKGFGIPTLSAVLKESEKLGDVVLVIDAKSWSKRMIEAFSDVATSVSVGGPRFVLHAYGEKDLPAVTRLAKELGAGVILALYESDADDATVEKLAKDNGVLAVLADERRFNPWLAKRLHAANIGVLVHTVNEHQKVAQMTLAGADGFYTDSYVPYATMAKDPGVLLDCGRAAPSTEQLSSWIERDASRKRDYRLKSCVKRKDDRLELADCGEGPAVTGPFLAVPPNGAVHVELDVEAPATGSTFWLEIMSKKSDVPLREREKIKLKPSERQSFTYDVPLANGSAGVETRLGFDSDKEQLTVHRLRVTQKAPDGSPAP
jgi:glycerophosphoryl diester phosphodiesterase